jgi:hypothetical protein
MARTSTPVAATAGSGTWLRLAGDLLAPPDRVDQRRGVDRLHLQMLDRLGEQGRLA